MLVLGPLLIEHDRTTVHVAGTHRRRLFALLASRAGRVVGVDAIVEALWGEDPPPTAAKTIQSHVARLRRSLSAVGSELIETTPGGYRLRADGVEVDADVFDRLTSDGRRRVATGDLTGAVSVLTEALAMWRGSPYADFPDSEFAVHERTRLVDSHATAREDLAEAQVESGATSAATGDLERLVGEHPGRERAWGLLMRAQYAAGRQHDALVAFQRARRAGRRVRARSRTRAPVAGAEDPGAGSRADGRQSVHRSGDASRRPRGSGGAGDRAGMVDRGVEGVAARSGSAVCSPRPARLGADATGGTARRGRGWRPCGGAVHQGSRRSRGDDGSRARGAAAGRCCRGDRRAQPAPTGRPCGG